jgi:hypothetical protein
VEKNLSNLYFTIFVFIFLVVLALVFVRHLRRLRRASNADWEQLLGRLERVDRDKIAAIAQDALGEDPTDGGGDPHLELDGDTIAAMVGGLEGLEILERNCRVLIDLAAYVQRWYPEAVIVAEQLRLNARELEWHVSRLKGAAQTGKLQTAFGDYAQRAVVIYYLMTRHVLELYSRTTMAGMVELQAAI